MESTHPLAEMPVYHNIPMWNDDKVIAICDNAVLRLDGSGRVDAEICKEGFKCSTNAISASREAICIATNDKAKLAFVYETDSYKVSVPELITALAFSRDGEILYAGSNTGRLYIWQHRIGLLVKSSQVFFNSITDAKVDFSNSSLLLSSQNGDLALFNLVELFSEDTKGTLYLGHSTTVISVANLMHGPHAGHISFVSISQDRNIRFWHQKKRTATESFFLEYSPLSLVVSRDATRLFIPCEMGHILVVPLSDFKGNFLLSGHMGSVTGCVETKNLITCALDGIRVWDVDTRLCISHYSNIGPRVTKLINDVHLLSGLRFIALKNLASDDSLTNVVLK